MKFQSTEDKEKTSFQREKTGHIQRTENNFRPLNSNGGCQKKNESLTWGKLFRT